MLKNQYLALGVMSGTSLDGLDLALSRFTLEGGNWHYKTLKAQTLPYSGEWLDRLQFQTSLSAEDLLQLDHDYGKYLGEKTLEFISSLKDKPDLIGSHGHTLYHRPEQGYTFQLGNGPEIFAATGITTICNFRRQDVALGGQGAPLVPIGDKLLFSEYDACLNLGGFANISIDKTETRIAFDICPVNFVLNPLARELGYDYDDKGSLAASAECDPALLEELNSLDFYRQAPPKSLGAEWVEENFLLILEKQADVKQKLATATAHAAEQIARVINDSGLKTCLVTGGGAYNTFLIESIRGLTTCKLIIPDTKTVDFKEALIFSFLGVLRLRSQVNILSSVTGSSRDHCSGVLYDNHQRN